MVVIYRKDPMTIAIGSFFVCVVASDFYSIIEQHDFVHQ